MFGFSHFQYLAVVSASFQSSCWHGKLCDIIAPVHAVVLKGIYQRLLLHCCVFHIVNFVTFFKFGFFFNGLLNHCM